MNSLLALAARLSAATPRLVQRLPRILLHVSNERCHRGLDGVTCYVHTQPLDSRRESSDARARFHSTGFPTVCVCCNFQWQNVTFKRSVQLLGNTDTTFRSMECALIHAGMKGGRCYQQNCKLKPSNVLQEMKRRRKSTLFLGERGQLSFQIRAVHRRECKS